MKPKFKMSIQEMLDFNDACESAAQQCPQYRGGEVSDRDICLKNISAKQLVKHWKSNNTLWKYGYFACLSQDAEFIFKSYKEYKIKLAAWKLENEFKV